MLLDFEHITKNGVDYVLVPEKDFRQIQEELEDAEDLKILRSARKKMRANLCLLMSK